MLLEKSPLPVGKAIPLPVLILFWVSAAGLIDAALYEYLRAGWYLIFDHELPPKVNWLNLAFLPIGIGLIRRNPDSKGCFQTLLFLLFILILTIVGAEIFDIGSTSMEGSGWAGWILIAGLSLWIVAVLWCFHRYENYFNNPEPTPERRRNEKAIVSLIIISGALSSLTIISKEYDHEKQIDSTFAVHLDFYAIDSESKQPIKNCRFNFERSASPHLRESHRSFKKDGVRLIRWGVSGFTDKPFKIEFSADGYENNELKVTKESAKSLKSETRVQLKRLSTAPSGPSQPEETKIE